MREIEIVVLFPRHLNLNGDLANAGVLAKRLGWYGYGSNVSLVDIGDPIPAQVDLIVLGHGSKNAWNEIFDKAQAQLEWLSAAIAGGVFTLAIASGYEYLAAKGHLGSELLELTKSANLRRSEFATIATELSGSTIEALGYVNSESKLPLLVGQSRLIGSLLHGPLLAKNAKLADLLIQTLTGELPSASSDLAAEQIRRVDAVAEQIWKLEKPD